MKMFNKIWGLGIMMLILAFASPNKSYAQGYVTDQEFYDGLEPYGTWVYDPDYGNVWVPDVDEGFQPYATRGHWAMTSYGNTWVSDYDWGWAPFHYGRWRFDNYYGWVWIPGYEWAPAWVAWRQGGGYYGWAPLSPGININLSFGNYNIPDNYWVCAPQAYITSPNIYNYYVPYNRRVTIINRTTYINNTYVYNNRRYYSGPRANDVERITGRPVRIYNINNSGRPERTGIRDNSVNIYRPAVRRVENARPARVIDGAAYQRENPNQRIADRSAGISRGNADRLARVARSEKPDNNLVRVNENRTESRAARRNEQIRNRANDNNNGDAVRSNVNRRDQQLGGRESADDNNTRVRPQRDRDVRNNDRSQRDVQRQQRDQQADQSRQQQQGQMRQQHDVQRQQRDQQADQTRQQQQDEQRRQQADQQRQQQQEQMRQQRDQQRQQQDEQRRQQADQQRQQQQEQMRQQRDQQRQQQEEQRRQQADQQRQQQQEQARQQADQQRQQQQEQMRQQRDQQRQQQQEQRQQQRDEQRGSRGGGRPGRN